MHSNPSTSFAVCTMYSENNRVLRRRLKLSLLNVGSHRSSLSEFQAVGKATANVRRPYELRFYHILSC